MNQEGGDFGDYRGHGLDCRLLWNWKTFISLLRAKFPLSAQDLGA